MLISISSAYNYILIMKNKGKNSYRGKQVFEAEEPDSSITALAYGAPQRHMNMNPSKSLGSSSDDDLNYAIKVQRDEHKRAKKEGLDHLYKQDYQPAKFAKAVEYRNSRSYMKKLPSGHYVLLHLFLERT